MLEHWVDLVATAVISGAGTVLATTFWLGRNTVTKADLMAATATTTGDIRELETKIDSHSREVGETVAALRQKILGVEAEYIKKITEVELYVRDTFVRRDSWHQAMGQIQERWSAGDKITEERALRLEAKVDRLIDRLILDKAG